MDARTPVVGIPTKEGASPPKNPNQVQAPTAADVLPSSTAAVRPRTPRLARPDPEALRLRGSKGWASTSRMSSVDKDEPVAIGIGAGASPVASAAAATAAGAAAVSDWLRTSRAAWDSFARILASSRVSSSFFATLPSIYAISILIYISVRLSADISACVVAAYYGNTEPPSWAKQNAPPAGVTLAVGSLVSVAGAFTGVALVCTLASITAIIMKWPGVLSFWTWVIEVIKDWFIVTFSILICTWQPAFAKIAPYIGVDNINNIKNIDPAMWERVAATLATSTMAIMVGLLLPAILILQLSTSVVTRQRMIFSGE